ncbi:MAG: acetyltransferase [Acidimicrobiales bacterium]
MTPPAEVGRPLGPGAQWLERSGERPEVPPGVRLVIVGAGGHGRDVLDAAEADGRYEVLGLVDDGTPDEVPLTRRGAGFLGPVHVLEDLDACYVLAIGAGRTRRLLDHLLTGWGRAAGVVAHPSATFGADVVVHPGLVVLAGARVTNHVWLGRHVHLNLNATAAHDVRLDDYVTLNPGANVNGNVRVGEEATIGSNASVNQGREVGAGTYVGAGAVVVHDLEPGITAVGIPARRRG